jgi:hypothetical protein
VGLFWMHVEKKKISFPSLGFELQTVQPVGSYSTGFCFSIVVDIFVILGNFKTLTLRVLMSYIYIYIYMWSACF